MEKPDSWYVAYTLGKSVTSSDKASGATRNTKTFKSEADAKLFALQLVEDGCNASAGTLNPYSPKQTIGPLQIEDWARSADGSMTKPIPKSTARL